MFIRLSPEICTENVHSGCPDMLCVQSCRGDEKARLPPNLGKCNAGLAGTPKTGFREGTTDHVDGSS